MGFYGIEMDSVGIEWNLMEFYEIDTPVIKRD